MPAILLLAATVAAVVAAYPVPPVPFLPPVTRVEPVYSVPMPVWPPPSPPASLPPPETAELPRCATIERTNSTATEYARRGRWHKNHLTYRVARDHAEVPYAVADAVLGRALRAWGQYVGMTFARADPSTRADVQLSFWGGAHPIRGSRPNLPSGPCDPLQPGTLGHAFFPPVGVVHVNEWYRWHANVRNLSAADRTGRADLYETVLHEVGHALGLYHDDAGDSPTSIMQPYSRNVPYADPHPEAHEVRALRRLYEPLPGAARSVPLPGPNTRMAAAMPPMWPPSPPPGGTGAALPPPRMRPTLLPLVPPQPAWTPAGLPTDETSCWFRAMRNLCRAPTLDAALLVSAVPAASARILPSVDVFVGSRYYRVTYRRGLLPRYPRPIADRWPGLTGPIDAAFEDLLYSRKAYFIRAGRYWRYSYDRHADRYSPDWTASRSVARGFPGVPPHGIRAATMVGRSVLFFYANAVVLNYTRNAPAWRVPLWFGYYGSSPDAVVSLPRGRSIFVFGDTFYTNVTRGADTLVSRPYRSAWFGCELVPPDLVAAGYVQADDDGRDVLYEHHDRSAAAAVPLSPLLALLVGTVTTLLVTARLI